MGIMFMGIQALLLVRDSFCTAPEADEPGVKGRHVSCCTGQKRKALLLLWVCFKGPHPMAELWGPTKAHHAAAVRRCAQQGPPLAFRHQHTQCRNLRVLWPWPQRETPPHS